MSNPKNQCVRAAYRMKHLPERTGLGTSLIYREIKAGNFPKGRLVAPGVRVWTEEEVAEEMQRRFTLYNK